MPAKGNLTNNSCNLSACWGLNGYRDLRGFSSSYLWTLPLYAQQCIQIEGKESPEKEWTEILTMTWKCSSTAWKVLISFSSQILACYIHLLRSQLALVEHRLSQPCSSQLSPLTPWSVPRVSSAGPSTIVVFCPSAHELSFWNRMVKNQTPKTISPTHHGGPYFSFLVVQQPRHVVAIANNCRP